MAPNVPMLFVKSPRLLLRSPRAIASWRRGRRGRRPSRRAATAAGSSPRTGWTITSTSASTRDKLYKDRSSRKTDSQYEKRSLGSPIRLKIVSENRFSGKTYFYTISSRGTRSRSTSPRRGSRAPRPNSSSKLVS